MQKLLIKEFSLNSHTEFEHPISESQAHIPDLAAKMLVAFPNVLRAEDISSLSESKLYDYRLVLKLFGGAADATLSCKTLTTNFRDGRSAQALELVAKSVDEIYKIMANRSVLSNNLSFGVHSQFESPDAYRVHMEKFANAERGYLSGGTIIQADARDFKGELRFYSEKSATVDNGLFVHVQFFTPEPFTGDLLSKMAKRFNEIANFEGIELAFPQ